MAEESDTEIIQRILAGNINSFAMLLRKYQPFIFATIRKHLAGSETFVEEIAQEVSINLYKSLIHFQYKSSLKTWLHTIIVRACYKFLNKKQKQKEDNFSSLQEVELNQSQQEWIDNITKDSAEKCFEENVQKAESKEILALLMNHLSPDDRMALSLIHLEGYSIAETAKMLNWSESNTKVRSFRAKLKMQEFLKQIL